MDTFTRFYNNFSGTDITITDLEKRPIEALQSISYSVFRESTPIYILPKTGKAVFPRRTREIIGFFSLLTFYNPIPDKFHIVITAANDQGDLAYMQLHECKIIEELDPDLWTSDTLIKFKAESIIPWTTLDIKNIKIEEEKDNHQGMIFNPCTNSWSWL